MLTKQGSVTAGELADKFEVSRRTIYRDIDALSLAGIPVYTQKGKGGGIYILPDFVLDKTLFSKDEQQQLVAHFESLASIGTPDTQGVLNKLSALFGTGSSWLEVDFAPWGNGEAARVLFRQLRDAILFHKVVCFLYTGSKGEISSREVEPLRILFRGQGWYLYGYSREREDFRYFKLTRIHDLQIKEEFFIPSTPVSQAKSIQTTEPTISVELRFSSTAAFRVYDEFTKEQITKEPDGNYLVKCHLPDGDWLLGYLLSYGSALEVVSPIIVRNNVINKLQKMLHLYNK